MISSDIGRAAFHIGFFVTLMSGLLLLLVEPGSAEQIITLMTFIVGLLFTLIIVALVRFGTRRQ